MAENENGGATAGNGAQPSLNVLAQYVKDLSFENPGAPQSLRGGPGAPAIGINVNVGANPIGQIRVRRDPDASAAKAENGKDVLFNVELVYGGVFRIERLPAGAHAAAPVHRVPAASCSRSRARSSRTATRNGGFPPLLIDPIDFAQMFQARMAEEQARAKVQMSS
jgi:preprotein translocase subunit SecB